MRVGLFTHCFLEPTHFAMGQLLDAAENIRFNVFARRFGVLPDSIGQRNVESQTLASRARVDDAAWSRCDLLQAVYDGDVVFDAAEVALRANKPLVISFHGGFDTNAKIHDARYRERSIDVCNTAQAITVVGPTDKSRLKQLGVCAPIFELPVSIDAHLVEAAKPDGHTVLVVARLIPKKGVDIALSVIEHLPAHLKLIIIGDGPERNDLQRRAHELGVSHRVAWLGYSSLLDMLKVLSRAEMLLHTARVATDGNAEGTPQIILWAQAAGVPVVATDTGSIRDIVTDRTNGLLVPANATAIGAAAREIIDNPDLRKALVTSAFRTVRKHQLSHVSQTLRDVYRSALVAPIQRPSRKPQHPRIEESLDCAAARLGIASGQLTFIDAGGHGRVYLASGAAIPVAVKVPAYDAHDEQRWSVLEHKLLREFLVLQNAACRSLPQPVACDPQGRFLARSYIAGEPLSRAYRYVPRAYRKVLLGDLFDMGRDLFPRFHESPRGTFLIRDFKPQNIIVGTGESRAMQLIDVGAVHDEAEIGSRKWDQSRLGTGQWLHWSPEQLLGEREAITRAVDYFALGATAYFTLMGSPPFDNLCVDPTRVYAIYQEQYKQVVQNLAATGIEFDLPLGELDCIIGLLNPDPGFRLCQLPPARTGGWNITPRLLFGLQ
jgi:glycosyltransferase involved in cell wall biosynthesis